MTCYRPVPMWQDLEEGGRLVPKPPPPGSDRYVLVYRECRHCLGCQAARADEFGIRGYHESRMHERSSFITCTYDPGHLPQGRGSFFAGGMLSRRDQDLFEKRLRKHFWPLKIRMLGCGEYGESSGRAHLHYNLFGVDFSEDRVARGKSHSGATMYQSPTLDALWGKGMCTIQDVNADTARYTAKYGLKTSHLPGLPVGMRADGYIPKAHRAWRINPETGKRFYFEPPYLIASRKPGLGYAFLEKFFMDIWNAQAVVLPGGEHAAIPKYYLRQIAKWSEEDGQVLKELRKTRMLEQYRDSMPRRLQDRELVARAGVDRFARDGV